MDVTLVRKFQAFILIILNIVLCVAAASSYVHVHMTNSLSSDSIIYLHCFQNGREKGHQQIPYHWTCQWSFQLYNNNEHLSCYADLQGAKELHFIAFNQTTDSCRDSCAWNFTQNGVSQFMDGQWTLRYTWPH